MRRYEKHANISVLFLILSINPSGNFESDLNALNIAYLNEKIF